MAQPQVKIQTKSQTAVQEYMDTMLTDLFPAIPDEPAIAEIEDGVEPALKAVEPLPEQTDFTVVTPDTATAFIASEPVVEAEINIDAHLAHEIEHVTEQQTETDDSVKIAGIESDPSVEVVSAPEPQAKQTESAVEVKPLAQVESATAVVVEREVGEIPEELRYPNAPPWAQVDFDVLLFDVCGLKLAVPMESLGRIIKTEHETNNLIGRPDWFIGAYSESEQRLFVVDTAKYIMPEKGFDLAEEGYDYIIQLQRTQWTLACKNVHTTVRLQPDQVKWRGEAGKRPWLAGTVVDHMCALLHVDSLIELLNNEVPNERGE